MPEWLREVPCDVYDNLSDDDMFHLVELWHGDLKKKEWSPYSSALMYKTRIDRDGKTPKELSYGHKKTEDKITRQVRTIEMMMAHNVEEEKMFSYFDSYMLLKQDQKNSIKDVFKDKPELFKKFEKNLVITMHSSDKNTSALVIRSTLTAAKSNKFGKKKMREFAEDGDFSRLTDWMHSSGNKDDVLKTLKKITDDFYDIKIKDKLKDKQATTNQKNDIKLLLKRIKKQAEQLSNIE